MARFVRVVAALAAVGAAAAATGAPDALEAARALERAGHYSEALAQVKAALTRAPDDARMRFLEGVLLTEMHRNDEAIAVFTALTHSHPDLPEPYNNLAVLHAAAGEYEKARDDLVEAINTHPSYATAHENLGDIYAKMAGLAYDKALQLHDGNATAKTKLALIGELFSVERAARPGLAVPSSPPSSRGRRRGRARTSTPTSASTHPATRRPGRGTPRGSARAARAYRRRASSTSS